MRCKEIEEFCKKHPNKKLFWRSGIDYRFSDEDGVSIKGYLRNKEVTLEQLLNNAGNYSLTELEKDECTADSLVFHSYSCCDLE